MEPFAGSEGAIWLVSRRPAGEAALASSHLKLPFKGVKALSGTAAGLPTHLINRVTRRLGSLLYLLNQ